MYCGQRHFWEYYIPRKYVMGDWLIICRIKFCWFSLFWEPLQSNYPYIQRSTIFGHHLSFLIRSYHVKSLLLWWLGMRVYWLLLMELRLWLGEVSPMQSVLSLQFQDGWEYSSNIFYDVDDNLWWDNKKCWTNILNWPGQRKRGRSQRQQQVSISIICVFLLKKKAISPLQKFISSKSSMSKYLP